MSQMVALRAAIWARVGTTEMENQLRQLREAAVRRGLEVVEPVYVAEASAWEGRHRADLDRALTDARAGKFDVLLCWALDRLTREGPLETLQILDRFAKAGVQVVSLQESWTEAAGELGDLLLAIVGWVARFESTRRSERTKAGIEQASRQGKPLGRRTGSKDSRRRKRSGYVARWERPGERERARQRALGVNNGAPTDGVAANSAEASAEAR